jgi:hypothetical protein
MNLPFQRIFRGLALLVSIELVRSVAMAQNGQWQTLTPLPDGYQEHILVYADGFLYNIGGVSATQAENNGTNVYYSKVYTSGTIGPWNLTTPLPAVVFDAAGIADDGFIYVLGGNSYTDAEGDFPTNAVYYARINPDGSLSNWQTANPLPQSIFFFGIAVWNHIIYTTGGTTDINVVSNVCSARVLADGSLSL